MKILKNRSLFKKLTIILIVILLFSVCAPKAVSAVNGGTLLDPVMSLFVGLADGAMTILQKVVLHQDMTDSIIQLSSSASFWADVLVILAAIVIVVAIVAVTILTAGTGTAALFAAIGAAAIKATLTIGVIVITFPIATTIVEGMLPGSFEFPLFEVTPQEIFSNKIPLLDVNFFNPSEETYEVTRFVHEQLDAEAGRIAYFNTAGDVTEQALQDAGLNTTWDAIKGEAFDEGDLVLSPGLTVQSKIGYFTVDGTRYRINCTLNGSGQNTYISAIGIYRVITEQGNVTETFHASTAYELRETIASWYVVLRRIALVLSLSVLVYVGIRILLSSTSNDKAKYKQMIIDWVVAVCLMFVMHYIMAFANLAVDKLIEVIDSVHISVKDIQSGEEIGVEEPEVFVIQDSAIVDKAYETLVEKANNVDNNPYKHLFLNSDNEEAESKSDVKTWIVPAENFMQQARIQLQLLKVDDNGEGNETYVSIGWKLIYVALVILTFIFIFTYVKRVIYLAFLTIIAPLVALTYPIDKLNDGKAQAFNMWLREYIFNLLIQPMHLILYTVLISSAMSFASRNVIYVIVALGFMVPAEKLLRSFFGFEKAKTPGLLGGPAGAAIMMSGINSLLKKGPKGEKDSVPAGGGKASGKDNSEEEGNNIKTKDTPNIYDSIGGKEKGGEEDNSDESPVIKNGMKTNDDESSTPKSKEELKAIAKANRQARKENIKKGIDQKRRKLKNGLKSSKNYLGKKYHRKPLRNLAKGIGGAAGALTLGVAGGIAGMMSGDPSKAVQYMGASAIGGYKLGSGMVDKAGKANEERKEAFDAFKKGYDPDKYKEKQQEKEIKEYRKDYENQEELLNMCDGDQSRVDEIMNNVLPDGVQYGITETEDLFAVSELMKNHNLTKEQAFSEVSYVKKFGKDTNDLGAEDEKELNAKIKNNLERRYGNDASVNVGQMTKDLRKNIDRTSSIWSKAKKKKS